MKVLHATDGFDPARDAGLLLGELVDRERVEVAVVSVADYTPIPATKDLERARAAENVEDAVARLVQAGFEATGRILEGVADEELVRVVEEEGFDLTVLGAGRNTWLGRLLLGSVSLHVLHHVPTSVLIVHQPPQGDPPHRVLVGVDGSEDSDLAVRTAVLLLDPARCRLEVVSVAEPLVPTVVAPGGAYVDSEMYEDMTGRVVEAHQQYVEEAVTRLRDAGFRAEGDVLLGHPATQLLSRAEKPQAALVLLGSRGLGPVSRLVLGSVSDRVARHAPATLVARRPA